MYCYSNNICSTFTAFFIKRSYTYFNQNISYSDVKYFMQIITLYSKKDT